MSGATPLYPHVPSWHTKGQLYLDLGTIVTTGPDERKVHLDCEHRYAHFPQYVSVFFFFFNISVLILASLYCSYKRYVCNTNYIEHIRHFHFVCH